jgi:hypothetical protein
LEIPFRSGFKIALDCALNTFCVNYGTVNGAMIDNITVVINPMAGKMTVRRARIHCNAKNATVCMHNIAFFKIRDSLFESFHGLPLVCSSLYLIRVFWGFANFFEFPTFFWGLWFSCFFLWYNFYNDSKGGPRMDGEAARLKNNPTENKA